MMRTLAMVGTGLLGTSAVLGLVFVWGMRTKNRLLQGAIRRMNRRITNPRQLRTAGTPGAYAAVVHHVGRTSGTAYRTPVVAVPDGDAFVVALPYGPAADWVRNVLAAGTATLEHEGRRVQVDEPTVVPEPDTGDLFTPREHLMHRIFGVDDVLRVHTSGAGPG